MPPNHIWSVEDVRKVREKNLWELNPDLDDFSVPLSKWRGEISGHEILQMWDDELFCCCSDPEDRRRTVT